MLDCCTRKTMKHNEGNIMVWGAMSSSGVGSIYWVVGTMNVEQYMVILKNILVPSKEKLIGRQEGVLMQDNDPKHKPKPTKRWLPNNNVTVLTWPLQSPDLNHIEQRILGLKWQEVTLASRNETELRRVCQEA